MSEEFVFFPPFCLFIFFLSINMAATARADINTHYTLLGVSNTATHQQITRAYRRLAARLHPDKNPSPSAASQFTRVHDAYEVLIDASQRRVYDASIRPSVVFPPMRPTRMRKNQQTAYTRDMTGAEYLRHEEQRRRTSESRKRAAPPLDSGDDIGRSFILAVFASVFGAAGGGDENAHLPQWWFTDRTISEEH